MTLRGVVTLWVAAGLAGAAFEAWPDSGEATAVTDVIGFSLDDISADGLIGPANGLVAVSYEFCIPDTPLAMAEVSERAPGIRCYAQSPGRIGCSEYQRLCIGETHGPGWRRELEGLAALPYVQRIERSYFE